METEPPAESESGASHLSSSLQDALQAAVAHYQAGDLLQAVRVFCQVLQVHPDHADTLLSLGIIQLQLGYREQAIELLTRVLTVEPEYVEAHFNLGNALLSQGKLAEAAGCYRRALALWPEYVEAHFNLGNALLGERKFAEAALSYRQALALQPDWAEAHLNLGNTLELQGKLQDAEASYRQARVFKPEWAEVHFNLGNVFAAQSKLEEAADCYSRAVSLNPEWVEAHIKLGDVLSELGYILEAQMRLEEAEASYQCVLSLKPDLFHAHINIGFLVEEQGKFSQALAHYQQALNLDPDNVQVHINRASLLLRMGDWEAGWADYEWRWQANRMHSRVRDSLQPPWDGSSLAGKTILLCTEQGLGDAIQFVRYAPLLKARGARVILECPGPLRTLMTTCIGIDNVVGEEALPAFDTYALLQSLPYLFGTRLATIPNNIPYIQAPQVCRIPTAIQRQIQAAPALKVGLVWSPKITYPPTRNDLKRHCPLAHFKPLLEVAGVSFYSLYKGERIEELAPYRQVVDLGSHFTDFADTAWSIAGLDLVITVDTSVAHLAGALGKPTWVLLPFVPDWRWLLEREDSPWYPTARLFRQQRLGEWAPVLERVTDCLREASREFGRLPRLT